MKIKKASGASPRTTFIYSLALTAWLPVILFSGCADYFKNDYDDNSPTSGKLKVYYDEGLEPHVKNQALTFESQYYNAHIELKRSSDNEAVQALFNDSCESIVISRLLSSQEKKAFESRNFFPKHSAVAKSGIAIVTGKSTAINHLSYEEIIRLLTQPGYGKDSLGDDIKLSVVFDKNNSTVVHYVKDSLLKGQPFSPNCSVLSSALESINYAAANKSVLAFIDFAWLSDKDDSIYRANSDKIKFLALGKASGTTYEYPSQSSFKLGTYPFIRTVYVIRKTGDFSLAKGFESFIAGPKGQLTFLKQGLLPARQGERAVQIKLETGKR